MTLTPLLLLLACRPGTIHLDDTGSGSSDGGADGGSSDGGADGGSGDGGTDGGSDDGGTDGGSGDGGTDGGSGDGGSGDGGTDGGGGDGGSSEAPDYRDAGPYSTTSSSGQTEVDSCDLTWVRYSPTGASDPPVLLLGHGYLRGPTQHADLGAHLASWGLTVYALDFCHSELLDVDHQQNGEDMVALAAALGAGPVIYAGHSAGGLSAIVAGADDWDALGVIGLDPVDAGNVGLDAADSVLAEVRAVFGESSACNASNNGVTMVAAAPRHQSLRVTESDHCDYEGPTDWGCDLLCTGSNDLFSDDEIRATIQGLATAAALSLAGLAPEADQWWTPGQPWYDALADSGAISPL